MKTDIYLAFVEFGHQHERVALDLLIPMLRRVFPGARVRCAVVDNALDKDATVQLGGEFDRLGGDNVLREFSGWDHALSWIQGRYEPQPASIVVLANDTVVRADKHGRVGNLPAERAAALPDNALVGWVDEYPRPIELFGLPLRQWIDTSLLVAEWRTLDALRPLARPLSEAAIFSDDWRRVFRDPSPLSENYRTYLKTYFFGERLDREFEHGWYAQEPVTERNFEEFKKKLSCVFCEHLLSARARGQGIRLVDIRPTPLAIDPLTERLRPCRAEGV